MNATSDAEGRIERLLQTTIGLDGSTVGSSLIHRAATRRMRSRGVKTVDAYADLIARDPHELQELVEEVVVGETYFFREREALFALAELVHRRRLVPPANEPLRVLSAPCSTGEEPYSIAITLLAAGMAPDRIAIDGVDVSHRAVELARIGIYRRNSFRGDTEQWQHYFVAAEDGFTPVPVVRSVVRITEANVLAPLFRPPHDQYDAIFCRNLLIYFDLEAQERLIAALIRHLAPEGVLFVGAADTFAVRRAGFAPLGRDLSFAYRLGRTSGASVAALAAADELDARERTTRSTVARGPVRAKGDGARSVKRSVAPARTVGVNRATAAVRAPTRPMPVAVPATPATPTSPGEEIAALANAGRLDDAARLGEAAVARGEASAALLALLGTVLAALGDGTRAERHYRSALYLDPHHEETLLHLATVLEGRGDRAGATRLRDRARRRRSDADADRSGA